MSRALGRYELLRPLARGGMAEVYLARRRAAGVEKWLVVKRIRAERSGDARFLDLFMREARLSMSLVHQNIVPVFDFGRIDDQVFLAMERVEGKDLGSTLARAGGCRVSPLVAAFIAAECCQALDYAHHRRSPEGAALGIVHRDVTPRNVLLSWAGEVKLTDFGIAALAGDATAKLLGTPAYMAPEQARGEALDARADVYAVGLLLRELLTGQRARAGTEREHYLEAAKVGALLPWPDDIHAPLAAIVDRATAIQPDDRFPDARSMLAELDAVIVGERAARKSEAPARLLAAWMDETWGSERDDAGPDGDVEAGHLVSFLDDGALDAVGTGTERSLVATSADDAGLPAPHPDASSKIQVASTPAPQPELALPRALSQSDAVPRESSPSLSATSSGTQQLATERRIGTPVIAGMVLAAAGLGALAMVVLRDRAPAASEQRVAETPAPSPPPPAPQPTRLTTPTPPPPNGPTNGQTSPTPGQDRPTSGQNRPTNRKPTKPANAAGSGVPAGTPTDKGAIAAIVMRKVSINATPWAYFTIDDDSTQHETMKTVQLAPGKHRIHFSNPVLKVERDVTIDVPTDRDTSHVERLAPP